MMQCHLLSNCTHAQAHTHMHTNTFIITIFLFKKLKLHVSEGDGQTPSIPALERYRNEDEKFTLGYVEFVTSLSYLRHFLEKWTVNEWPISGQETNRQKSMKTGGILVRKTVTVGLEHMNIMINSMIIILCIYICICIHITYICNKI